MNTKLILILLLVPYLTFTQNTVNQIKNKAKTQKKNFIVKLKSSSSNKEDKIVEKKIFLNEKNLVKLHKKLKIVSYEHIINHCYFIKYSNDSIPVNKAIELYKKTGLFEFVESNGKGKPRQNFFKKLDRFTPDDEYYNFQWYLNNNGDYNLYPGDKEWDYHNTAPKANADIKMEDAWIVERGNPDLIVAIIDGGVYLDHPEFKNRIWTNTKEIPNNNIDDDGNGYIDDVHGWDFVENQGNVIDDGGHGTAVAGIALASNNNGTGYAGINGNSKLMALKIYTGNDDYEYVNLVKSLKYAVDHGAKVINMSFGQWNSGNLVKEGVIYAYKKGAIMVAATANDGSKIGTKKSYCTGNENRHDFPGCFPQVITVGGTIYDDSRMVWREPTSGENGGSAYGYHIDVVAPGYSIYSLGNNIDNLYPESPGYGCSFAAPQVAGVISLILSINPDLTFEQVRDILRSTADDQVGRFDEDIKGFDQYMGYGRLNAHKALLKTKESLDLNGDEFKKITTYPNPVKDIIHVKSDQKIKSLTVYSTLGSEILKANNVSSLNLSKLSGVYLLKIELEDGSFSTKKIICS